MVQQQGWGAGLCAEPILHSLAVCFAALPYDTHIITSHALQSKDYDPTGEYVKTWCPELKNVPVTKVHEPWLMSKEEQERSGCRIGVDYPNPIPSSRHGRPHAGAGACLPVTVWVRGSACVCMRVRVRVWLVDDRACRMQRR